jgi:putative spermidine/putrescine transport system ATP-binding protein
MISADRPAEIANPTSRAGAGSSVELQQVNKLFGRTKAVDDVGLRIERGEFVTLLGPSGSGKTTILRMIAGFELPSSGAISIGDTRVDRMPPAERNIGMVFQHYALFPHLTVQQNVAYGLKMRRWNKGEKRQRILEMLELVGLEQFSERHPRELSGGQQQRVALARALAIRPQLLLMDEPLGALDRALRVGMSEEIKRLHRETGTTFLYVTHDQEEALLLSDRVVIMRDGKVKAAGTPQDLFNRPPTQFVAEFFGGCNVLASASVRGASDGNAVVRYGGRETVLNTAYRGESAVAFQPHKANVMPGEVGPEAMAIEGHVVDVLFMGMLHQVIVVDKAGQRLVAKIPAHAADGCSTGDSIKLSVAREDLILLNPESSNEK